MPESEDESQEIAAKGLLCSVRYPGSDLSRLRMIWRPHAELERFRVAANAGHSPPGRHGRVLWLAKPPRTRGGVSVPAGTRAPRLSSHVRKGF